MKLAAERFVPSVAVALLMLFVLQTLPATIALTAPLDSVHPEAIPGFKNMGAAADGLPVTVSIAIPLRNIDLLSSLVKEVSDPSSPMFRHFPSQQQIAQEFYPTEKFDQLMQYISTTPLQVQYTALDSTIVLSGTAVQVERAFGTGIAVYSNGTKSYYMSTSESFMGAYLFASNATALMLRPATAYSSATGANVTFTEGGFSAKLLQSVYNATSLYSKGYNGSGFTIGILDFYGSPTIVNDLNAFDKRFGFPDANFTIIPIGPYDPNLGVYAGFSAEISIDVELSHAMAPGAAVDLYIGSGAETLSDVISKIVKDDRVNTLSQSFAFPEWAYNYLGPGFFNLYALMPDQYYMLGALKGITFSGSTGDTGGSGDTSGIEGELGYPSDSPYVTAVGGTQTYFAGNSSLQTAWSDLGFVPNGVNYGGSSGGVSILEPKPWYQDSQQTPESLPSGRMVPDLSLQGGVDPATYVVDAGQVIGEGGTSESSPLFAGLVTLLDSSIHASVGLLNPFLYSLGNNSTAYTEGYTPITFGYTIPWVASKGYNLVTGWGAPNIGEMSSLYRHAQSQPGLNVTVELYPGKYASGLEYIPGSILRFNATIQKEGLPVVNGSFTADLVTLTSMTSIPLRYDSTGGVWTGSTLMQNQSGLAYLNVQGTSAEAYGSGFAPLFAGYFGLFIYPIPTDPWSTVGGLPIVVKSTTLDGNATFSGPLDVQIDRYSIRSNSYSKSVEVTLSNVSNSFYGEMDEFILNKSIPSGPSVMVTQGATYGYLPFVSGIYLQTAFIYPPVLAEPGSVGPGQELTIIAFPVAPFNLYSLISQETGDSFGSDVAVGSNITAQLVSPDGSVVSSVSLVYQSCKEALLICEGGAYNLNGYLPIPKGSSSGLYTILLDANYSSKTIGKTINGSFYSQVWISGVPAQPDVSVEPGFVSATTTKDIGFSLGGGLNSSSFYEGEHAHLVAKITYSNGTEARFGEYTAIVYPQSLENQYTSLMHSEYSNFELVLLTYDPALRSWLGNITLPGPSNEGTIAPLNGNSFSYSGPYEVYVTGITANGLLTTTAEGAQEPFYIQPYVLVDGGNVTSLIQNSQFAFSGVTFKASGSLAGDIFLGTDSVEGGTLTITGSQIQGSLVVKGANVTLVGVSGGDVSATDSTITLKDSSVVSLSLADSRASVIDSSYESVTPVRPTIAVVGLSRPISGITTFNVTVTGSNLTPESLTAWIDGNEVFPEVSATPSGLFAIGTINASSLSDGVHSLKLIAQQSDGFNSTLATSFSTNSQAASLASQLSQAKTVISSLQNQLSQSKVSVGTLYDISYFMVALIIVAVVVAAFALRKKTAAA